MSTPEQFDRQARLATARAAHLRALATTLQRTSAPLVSAVDELTRRHTADVWSSSAASRSRTLVRGDKLRAAEAKRLCDVMAARLRSAASDQEYIAYRATGEAAAARRQAAEEPGR